MPSYIGIDIGSRWVKVVEAEYKKKYILKNAFLFPTPYIKNTPSKNIDSKEFLRQLSSVIPDKVLKFASLGVNIPSSLVTVTVVNLPKMSRRELEIAAVAEAKRKMVPTPGPNSIFEYLHLGEVVVERTSQYEMLVVKTEKPYIEEVLNTFNTVEGVYPFIISPNCYTILNFFPAGSPERKQETAFINIGYDSIDVTIAKDGNLYFYRNIKLGLRDIISHICVPLNINTETAESVVREKGVPAVDIDIKDRVKVAEEIMRQKYESTEPSPTQEINLLELRMLWETEVERIVHEIRRTLVYHKEQSKTSKVETFVFLGGGAEIPGLVPVLSTELAGKCGTISSFRGMEVPKELEEGLKGKSALFANAVSIIFSLNLSPKIKIINFLPLALKKRKLIIKRQVSLIIFALIAVSLFFLVWLNVFIANSVIKNAINRVDREAKKSEDVMNRLDKLKAEKLSIETKSLKVKDIIAKKIDIPLVLEEIVRIVPREALLLALSIKTESINIGTGTDVKYKLRMDVSCVCNYEEAVNLAERFQGRLEAGVYFENAILSFPELDKVTPTIGDGDMVALTERKERKFSFDADLSKMEQNQ